MARLLLTVSFFLVISCSSAMAMSFLGFLGFPECRYDPEWGEYRMQNSLWAYALIGVPFVTCKLRLTDSDAINLYGGIIAGIIISIFILPPIDDGYCIPY